MKKVLLLITIFVSLISEAQVTHSDIGTSPTYTTGQLVLMTDGSKMIVGSVTYISIVQNNVQQKKYTYYFNPKPTDPAPVAVVNQQPTRFLHQSYRNVGGVTRGYVGGNYYRGYINNGFYYGYGNRLYPRSTYYYGQNYTPSTQKKILGTALIAGALVYIFSY